MTRGPRHRRQTRQLRWCYPFVAAGVRRGSCAGPLRFRSCNFSERWSRTRARAWSASGSGMPPRGAAGDGGDGLGPEPPPPSDSEGPGDGSERRYSRRGTNIKAMTPRKNNNLNNSLPASSSGSDSTRWRATSTRPAINAGRARAASNARAQKCDCLCRPVPTAIQSATRKGSKRTTITITKPLKRSTVSEERVSLLDTWEDRIAAVVGRGDPAPGRRRFSAVASTGRTEAPR
jgi:hypothetical protein